MIILIPITHVYPWNNIPHIILIMNCGFLTGKYLCWMPEQRVRENKNNGTTTAHNNRKQIYTHHKSRRETGVAFANSRSGCCRRPFCLWYNNANTASEHKHRTHQKCSGDVDCVKRPSGSAAAIFVSSSPPCWIRISYRDVAASGRLCIRWTIWRRICNLKGWRGDEPNNNKTHR